MVNNESGNFKGGIWDDKAIAPKKPRKVAPAPATYHRMAPPPQRSELLNRPPLNSMEVLKLKKEEDKMKKIAIFLAQGCEEVEALTVVDILRRAGLTMDMISVTGDKSVTSSHNVTFEADYLFEDANIDEYDMLVLPGGMPGTNNLAAHKALCDKVVEFEGNSNKYIAAICAAPTVFGRLGLLKEKAACCYEGMEDGLLEANVTKDEVTVSGNIITSRGLGTAIPFALKLVEILCGKEVSDGIKDKIIYRV